MKMYSAAMRIYKRYGLSAIGIPYQYGLVRCCPASDLVEGMLNNADRPDVIDPETGKVISKGRAICHFNEATWVRACRKCSCARSTSAKGMPSETTLHDVRWGRDFEGKFVWVFLISGAAPPAHFGGWKKHHDLPPGPDLLPDGRRHLLGRLETRHDHVGSFLRTVRPDWNGLRHRRSRRTPERRPQDRLNKTSPEWPIASAYIPGYGRNQLMATHMSNHITIGYGDILQELISTCQHLGITDPRRGDVKDTLK